MEKNMGGELEAGLILEVTRAYQFRVSLLGFR